MKLEKLILTLMAAVLLFAFSGCASDDEGSDTDPEDPSGDKVTISDVSQYVFWGEELTITGTGFSSVKQENIVTFVNSSPKTPGLKLTSDGGDIQILDASPTSIKILVPVQSELKNGTTIFRGEDFTRIEVKVKEAKDTSDF